MRDGHSPDIIGIRLQPSALKRWALSIHICTPLKNYIIALADRYVHTSVTSNSHGGKCFNNND